MKREIKDSLFRNIFKEKEYLVELYYDISGNKLTPQDIRILELENYVMSTLRNDIAFIKNDDSMIVLIEHQSTTNYNMDVRLFLYYGRILENYINKKYKNGLHTSSKIQIPKAEFYVLFNGKAYMEQSDRYKTNISLGGIKIEFNTKIININFDDLDIEIKESKDALSSYAYLIKAYYYYREELINSRSGKYSEDALSKMAFEKALDACREQGLFLSIYNREEFKIMSSRVLTLEESMNINYEIGLSEGVHIGEKRGKQEEQRIIAEKMLTNNIDIDTIVSCTGLSEDEIKKL